MPRLTSESPPRLSGGLSRYLMFDCHRRRLARGVLLGVVEQAALLDDLNLTRGQVMLHREYQILRLVADDDLGAGGNLALDVVNDQLVAQLDLVVVGLVGEGQGQDAEVDEVGLVDAGKRLGCLLYTSDAADE